MRSRLTPKQARFVEEYLKDLNATQAYLRAGYQGTVKTAEALGPRLIGNDRVRAAIEAAMKARSERTLVTADQVLSELAPLAHSCLDHYVIDDDGNVKLAAGAPPDAMRALRSIKKRVFYDNKGNITGRSVEVTLWDKPKSLDLEGSHLGLWKQVHEVHDPVPLFALAPGDRPDVSGLETGPSS